MAVRLKLKAARHGGESCLFSKDKMPPDTPESEFIPLPPSAA